MVRFVQGSLEIYLMPVHQGFISTIFRNKKLTNWKYTAMPKLYSSVKLNPGSELFLFFNMQCGIAIKKIDKLTFKFKC